MGKYWLKYAHSTNYWQVDIDKKWAKYTTCSQAMGMLNIERNAVHGTLFVHSQSKVILTKIIENVHIILRVDSQSKVILTKIMQKCVHYTTCS